MLVAALSAFATYRYVKAGGKQPSNTADKARIAELQTKLKATQAQVQELEKRRHTAATRQVSEESKPSAAKPAPTGSKVYAASVPRPDSPPTAGPKSSPEAAANNPSHSAARSAATAPPLRTPSSKASTPATTAQTVPSKDLSNLQGNLAASHEEWQATTDRLGNVVGELDTQRSAIQQTQTGVNYLLERAQRSDIAFALRKGSGLQHVGPIAMELESTSVKGQHYSIRMMVDDKSIVLKDRALNEIVQFYTSRSKYPLRLIVSQIGRRDVSGTLAVPTELRQQINNAHLQER